VCQSSLCRGGSTTAANDCILHGGPSRDIFVAARRHDGGATRGRRAVLASAQGTQDVYGHHQSERRPEAALDQEGDVGRDTSIQRCVVSVLRVRLALGSIWHTLIYGLILTSLHRHHRESWNTKSTTAATANKLDQPSWSWTLPASALLNRPCCTKCDPSQTTWSLSWNFTDYRVRDPWTKSASERVSCKILLLDGP